MRPPRRLAEKAGGRQAGEIWLKLSLVLALGLERSVLGLDLALSLEVPVLGLALKG